MYNFHENHYFRNNSIVPKFTFIAQSTGLNLFPSIKISYIFQRWLESIKIHIVCTVMDKTHSEFKSYELFHFVFCSN